MQKWNDVGMAEQVVWDMRLADMPRGFNRVILNELYNGDPPESVEHAQENQHDVNRNFLEGTNKLAQARGQWNNAFLKQAKYFSVSLDSGPQYKRQDWSTTITRHINRYLKGSRQMMEQVRAEGMSCMIHGIGPSIFKDRRDPIPKALPIASVMIPSETDLDFDNLEYIAFFREWTPTQLYRMTHGPKLDPGWNMKAVDAQWTYIREQLQKEPNSTAFQYMPERIEELKKQDLGFWGSDAVPTIDVWDCYFRDDHDGNGWYRRIFLDWGVATDYIKTKDTPMPDSRNTTRDDKKYGGFLYTSGNRKFADYLSEFFVCQFVDCSAVSPPKYHSVRGPGWMLWGVCDIQNRLNCRFHENVFMNMLWWFYAASGNDMNRIKKAMFEHMGVIPQGIRMLTANERFEPDKSLIEMAFSRNRQILDENSAAFTQDYEPSGDKEQTATEVMARAHSVNALVGSTLTLAYEYSKYKYMEQCRRFCIKNSPYKMVRDFRLACLKDGVDEKMLDASRWIVEPERALGEGNKILSGAIVQFLQGIRKNLGPDAQRKVDHLSISEVTDQPQLAEDLAPIQGQDKLSPSTHDAQLATDRLLRGLTFIPSPEMVPEDYVMVWLHDMGTVVQQIQQSGGVGTPQDIVGLENLGQHIAQFLQMMESNEEEKPKVKQLSDLLGQLMNHVKAFAQRQAQAQRKQSGGNGEAAKEMLKIQSAAAQAKIKQQNMVQSHAIRSAQNQAAFEQQMSNEDRKANAEIRRENARTTQELVHNRLRHLTEGSDDA